MDKISFSDIIRFIVTGALGLIGSVRFFLSAGVFSINNILNINTLAFTIFAITGIVLAYFTGLFIYFLNEWISKFKFLQHTAFFNTIYNIPRKSKFLQQNKNTPLWLRGSINPEKITSYISLACENNKKSKIINENFEFHELFRGLFSVSFLLCIFSFAFMLVNLYIGLIFVIFYSLITILSSILVHKLALRTISDWNASLTILNINIEECAREAGVKRVYVMIRTLHDSPYFEDALRSVMEQDYYNIQIVVLEDFEIKKAEKTAIEQTINRLEKEYRKSMLKVIYLCHPSGNPAESSYTIRRHILNISEDENDIVFILDDDDILFSNSVISDVVDKMDKTEANLCLVKYQIFGEPQMNISRDNGISHNFIVNEISRKGKAVTINKEDDFRLVATMGWSKFYKIEILRKYFSVLEDTRNSDEGKKLQLISYEDFPDFLMLLLANTRITATNKTSYLYRKHPLASTRVITDEAFRHWRLDQLKLLKLAHNRLKEDDLVENSNIYLYKFISSKLEEIRSIVTKYNNEKLLKIYTLDEFNADVREANL